MSGVATGFANRAMQWKAGRLERIFRWQTPFSFVSALIPLLLALVFFADLLFPHPGFNATNVALWASVYLVAAVVPLACGHRYPLWAGIVMVALVEGWSTLFLIRSSHAHAEINALLELPIIALYVGWFYPGLIARVFMGLSTIRVGAALVWNPDLGHGLGEPVIMVSFAVLVALFCFEGARAVRRQGQLQYFTDSLTRALNRRGLEEAGEELRRRARKAGEPVSVALIDFDRFRQLNEDGGHSAGDEALRSSVASWIEAVEMRGIAGRRGGIVARLGGDEFVLVFRTGSVAAQAQLERVRAAADYAWSWGIVDVAADEHLDAAIERADAKLLAVKRAL